MKQLFKYHSDVNATGVNRLDAHNYFIPRNLGDPFGVYRGGGRLFPLDGEWQFDLFEDEYDYRKRGRSGFRSVPVPSCWQYYSGDRAVYINDKYAFPYDPPHIPADGVFGVYEKTFCFSPAAKSVYRLFFEGAESCLYAFLNGRFVGYAEISHSLSEFDVTDFLREGENLLSVRVYKYSTGSYLEDQDKIRLNGLFGSVYLVEREKEHIENYRVTYALDGNTARVKICFRGTDLPKKTTVFFADREICVEGVEECAFTLEGVELWNAEIPALYRAEIVCGGEKICEYLSFRKAEIEDGVFKINDAPVKLHGVNRHSFAYETGYFLPLEVMKRDVELMKACGINAVRTSHYPPAPEFLYLCDEYGLYVMEEADIETHGCVKMHGGHDERLFDAITDDDAFAACIEERVGRMLARDFNRGSVVIWSTGNEAGLGRHMIAAVGKLGKEDPSRLVHYESLYTSSPGRNRCALPFVSRMYASPEDLKALLRREDRPILLCEYSHAMGNSCGDLKDYYDLFDSEPRLMGGFVWEWNDQAFPADGLSRPGYGGDFGEEVDDGNFCLDGLLDYRRLPKSAWYELRALNCPLKVLREADGFYLCSAYVFKSVQTGEYALEWWSPGKETMEIDFPLLRPSKRVKIPVAANGTINFRILRKGEQIGCFSFPGEPAGSARAESVPAAVKETGRTLLLEWAEFAAETEERSGLLKSFSCGGKTLLRDAKLRTARAPLDNDVYEREKWQRRGLFRTYALAERIWAENSFHAAKGLSRLCAPAEKTESRFFVGAFRRCGAVPEETASYRLRLAANGVANVFEGRISYRALAHGLEIGLEGEVNPDIEYLPRFGLEFVLPKACKTFSYTGFGPHESYADKKNLAVLDTFSDTLDNEYVYLKPQEANSHCGTTEVRVGGLRFTADRPFSFNYSRFTVERLAAARHAYDLEEGDGNRLIIDYGMSGVGSGSCGPALDEKYALRDKTIALHIRVEWLPGEEEDRR